MAELLAVEGVTAGYGESVVLDDVSLTLDEGDSLALLGRNGMGKTTLLVTLMGLTRLHRGSLRWRGGDLARAAHAPAQPGRAGLGAAGALHVPVAHRRGAPHGRRAAGPLERRAGLRDLPAPCRAARQLRQPALRAASSRCWRSAAR